MKTGRRHDAYLLSESNLNARLAEVQQGNAVQCKVYGDAAYPIMSHIDRGFKGANLTPTQKAYNRSLSKVRICVEWMFGKWLRSLRSLTTGRILSSACSPSALTTGWGSY